MVEGARVRRPQLGHALEGGDRFVVLAGLVSVLPLLTELRALIQGAAARGPARDETLRGVAARVLREVRAGLELLLLRALLLLLLLVLLLLLLRRRCGREAERERR